MKRLMRILLWIVVAVIVVFVLFEFVYPWVDRTFVNDPTL